MTAFGDDSAAPAAAETEPNPFDATPAADEGNRESLNYAFG